MSFTILHFYGQDFIHICPAPLLLLNVIPVVNVHSLTMKVFLSKGLALMRLLEIFKIIFLFLQNFLNFLTFSHIFFFVWASLKFSLWERTKFLSHLIVFWKTVWTFFIPVMESREAPNMIQPCQCVPQWEIILEKRGDIMEPKAKRQQHHICVFVCTSSSPFFYAKHSEGYWGNNKNICKDRSQ